MDKQKPTVSTSYIDKEKSKHRYANVSMVQNVLLVWLDHDTDKKHKNNYRNAITGFRRVVHRINIFTECDSCVTFVTGINDDKVCIIVSGSLGQQIVPVIHNMSQVDSIFILCDNKKQYKRWAKEWTKIKGIFTDTSSIYQSLKEAVEQCEHDAIGIHFMSTNNTDDVSKQLDCPLMYNQIIKEILLTIEFKGEHVKEFINYCRDVFRANEYELNNIKQFK